MKHYVIDENNNKIEAYDKEEVLSVLKQAIDDGTLENIVADAAFVTKLKCCVNGATYSEAFLTQAQYNELEANNELIPNCIYNIIDDTTIETIDNNFIEINNEITSINSRLDALELVTTDKFTYDGTTAIPSTNELKRHGKSVIANFVIGNTGTNSILLNIPAGFKPKEETNIAVGIMTTTGLTSYAVKKITTGGLLAIRETANISYLFIENAGWEVE